MYDTRAARAALLSKIPGHYHGGYRVDDLASDLLMALRQAHNAEEELLEELAQRKAYIKNYDAVINSIPNGKVRVLIANALVKAYNGATKDELRDYLDANLSMSKEG